MRAVVEGIPFLKEDALDLTGGNRFRVDTRIGNDSDVARECIGRQQDGKAGDYEKAIRILHHSFHLRVPRKG